MKIQNKIFVSLSILNKSGGNIIKEFDFDFTAIGTFENGFIWIETKEETVWSLYRYYDYHDILGRKLERK